MDFLHKQRVYNKVPLQQCLHETGKQPIGTRWLDTNKMQDGAAWWWLMVGNLFNVCHEMIELCPFHMGFLLNVNLQEAGIEH